jgi:hypothetical protein
MMGFLAASGAFALTFKSVTAPATLVYSPDAIVQTTGRIRVVHDSYSGPFCVVLTQLSLLPAPVAPAEGLSYALYQPDTSPTYRLSLDGAPTNSTEVLTGSFATNPSYKRPFVDLGFAVFAYPSTLPPPGTYTATIRANLYASDFPATGAPSDTTTFAVTVTVSSVTDISIVPTGASFSVASTAANLSFGVLSANATRALDLLVRANVRYSLSLVSANGGALSNQADGSLIGYSLAASGSVVPLQAGVASFVGVNADATYSRPAKYGISVSIRPFADFPVEGTYSDLVTVNVIAP